MNSYLDSLYEVSSNRIDQYDYKGAIEAAFFLVEEAKKSNNPYYSYHAHTVLGWGYGDLLDQSRSQMHYREALDLALELDNDTLILWSYNNLGNVYSEDKKTITQRINYYKKVIDLANKLNIPSEEYTPTLNIAWTYLYLKKYAKAKPYIDRALEIGDKKDMLTLSELHYVQGYYYTQVNMLDKTEEFFTKGIKLVEKNALILEASSIYWDYAALLYKKEDYKEAFLAMERYDKYNSQIMKRSG